MFISGFDVTLETVAKIRKTTKALIFLDVHNIVLGIDEKGRRFPQPWHNWKDWAKTSHIVQMNEEETKRAVGRQLKENQDFFNAALEIMKHGPSQIPITLGSRGSLIAYREKDDYYGAYLPAITLKRIVDTTGCGDNFIAGYLYGYLKYKNPIMASALGNTVAGLNCEYPGLMPLKGPEEAIERMELAYSEIIRKIKNGWKGNPIK